VARRQTPIEVDAPGQDSFLDVVANLVGILIILIMVVGVRAKGEYSKSSAEPETSRTNAGAAHDSLQAARQEFDNVSANVHDIERQLDGLQHTLAARKAERDHLNVLLEAANRDLAQFKSQLDEQSQRKLELAARIQEMSQRLRELKQKEESLTAENETPTELAHLPTPMAQTVFGRERHFRLSGGKLVYVPLNELTEQLRSEAHKSAWKLKDVAQITETIGPVQGFNLQYTLAHTVVAHPTGGGTVVRQFAELKHFVLLPVTEDLGETLEEALAEGSQFQQSLATMDPQDVVITVWTYPDSFAEFRRLKSWLFDRGYSTAARPLPSGQPITGSPQGSRSAAQ
jgi:hypothetical protein